MLCSYKCSCVFLYSSQHSGNPLSVEISLDFKHYHVSPEGFPGALVVLLSVIRKDFINIYSRSWLIITWSVTMVSFFFLSTTSINSIDPQHYWVYIKCSVFINYSLPTYEYLQHLSPSETPHISPYLRILWHRKTKTADYSNTLKINVIILNSV